MAPHKNQKTFFIYIPHFSSISNNLSPEVYSRKTHNENVILHREKMLCTALPTLANSGTTWKRAKLTDDVTQITSYSNKREMRV
jgi:hypothetical protein